MRKKIELLAPAGNKEIFKAAVDAGADAVYCGIDLYNARMNASNLTMDSLAGCVAYAHERSTLVHLTLNTLVDDNEIDEACNVACEAYNNGVDAILVQDMGLASLIHKKYPMIPLHASTQMNVFDADRLSSLKGNGFTRVVLPRELTIKEISDRSKLASRLNIETEVFIHGAVCVCTSGLCLFSSMNKSGTRSGNRGLCAQPCRQRYVLKDGGKQIHEGHILSPKDRCALSFIPELIDAGVSSVKIEGRMRDADYVKTAVSVYRRIIDACYDGSLTDKMIEEGQKELLVNFNRGGSFTSQALSGNKDTDLLSGEYVGKYGLKIGRLTLRDCKEGTITIRPSGNSYEPSKGDYLSLRDRNGEVKSFPVGKVSVFKGNYVVKGLHPSAIKELPDDLNVFLMNHNFEDKSVKPRKTHIDVTFDSSVSGVIKASARVTDGPFEDVFAEDELSYVDEGRGSLSCDRIEEQFRKTGSTAFTVDEFYAAADEGVNCSIKDINELRRGLLETLSSELLSEASHTAVEEFSIDDFISDDSSSRGSVSVLRYYPSLTSYRNDPEDADILAFSVYDYVKEDGKAGIQKIINRTGKKLMLVLPDFCHDKENTVFKKIKDVEFMPTAGSNIYNSTSLKNALKKDGKAFISYEVPSSDALNMLNNAGGKGTVFLHCGGFVPWMQTDFCPVGRNAQGCKACRGGGCYNLSSEEEGNEGTKVITHPLDCSAAIFGHAKYIFDNGDANEAASMGYDVIKCYTEV